MFGADGYPIAIGQEIDPSTPSASSRTETNVLGTAEPITTERTTAETSPPSQSGLIQSPSGNTSQVLPGSAYPYPSPPTEIIPHPLDQSLVLSEDDAHIKMLEPEAVLPKALDLYALSIASYTSYRSKEDSLTYMPGGGDQFGWLSFDSPNYLTRGTASGVTANMNLHLLSGPESIHLPPRLYDFELGYQFRNSLSSLFSYEWSAMVGIYSDFEDSARDGVRFPAHAVGMFHPGPRADWVFGVDYLGRDDIKVLPVAGFVWHDPQRPELRYEMVFPRPRIDLTLSPSSRIYCSGLLGGGTWDIEFPDESNDVMTYRDYRLSFGLEQASCEGALNSWELGWVFSRKLEFRDRPDAMGFDDAFVIRYVTRK